MPCNDIRPKIYDFLEGLLPESERDEVRAHLETCEACQQDLQSKKMLLQLENNIPQLEPSPYLAKRIMAHIEEEAKSESVWERIFSFFTARKISLGGLAAVTAIILMVASYRIFITEAEYYAFDALQSLPPSVVEETLVAINFRSSQSNVTSDSETETLERLPEEQERIAFFRLGKTIAEAYALTATEQYELAERRFKLMKIILGQKKDIHSLTQLPEKIDRNLGQAHRTKEQLLKNLSEVNQELERYIRNNDKSSQAFYKLGIALIRIQLFATAQDAGQLRNELIFLNSLLPKLKNLSWYPDIQDLAKELESVVSVTSPTPSDFYTIIDISDDLMPRIQSQ